MRLLRQSTPRKDNSAGLCEEETILGRLSLEEQALQGHSTLPFYYCG